MPKPIQADTLLLGNGLLAMIAFPLLVGCGEGREQVTHMSIEVVERDEDRVHFRFRKPAGDAPFTVLREPGTNAWRMDLSDGGTSGIYFGKLDPVYATVDQLRAQGYSISETIRQFDPSIAEHSFTSLTVMRMVSGTSIIALGDDEVMTHVYPLSSFVSAILDETRWNEDIGLSDRLVGLCVDGVSPDDVALEDELGVDRLARMLACELTFYDGDEPSQSVCDALNEFCLTHNVPSACILVFGCFDPERMSAPGRDDVTEASARALVEALLMRLESVIDGNDLE